jgi:hypothetical protein
MTPKEFVDGVGQVVLEASVSDTVSVVQSPPGRMPARELVELSNWFNALGDGDRAMVKRILELEARQAVFGLLSVIDGSRQIEPSVGPKGHFELRFIKDGIKEVLSGPDGEVLHELLE